MKRDATISECGRYRYDLGRTWVEPGDALADTYCTFIMLNPSTADGTQDDPTICRCINFAKSWGMGGLMVVNLFAWRATKPDDLLRAADPIGPENDRYIDEACRMAQFVVAAWGAHSILQFGRYYDRGDIVRQRVQDLRMLRLTMGGHPAHPLYLPGNLQPVPWK